MGNICRSPTAEGVFRKRVEEAGLAARIEIDSAGTHAYHIGEAPDPRAQAAARRRGVDLSALRGRQAVPADIERFDYILAMDSENYAGLMRICPGGHEHKVRLFMEFAGRGSEDVPDPYFGAASGFDRVLDMIEEACDGLLGDIRRRL
jgi:protein-tyrosine phosphatase